MYEALMINCLFDSLHVTGAVESLLKNLYSVNEEVRGSAAVALGYLSFNRTAARLMLVACRNTPGLYDILAANLGNGKMAMEFADDWQENRRVGLPSSRYRKRELRPGFHITVSAPDTAPNTIWGILFFYGNTMFRRLGQSATHRLRCQKS